MQCKRASFTGSRELHSLVTVRRMKATLRTIRHCINSRAGRGTVTDCGRNAYRVYPYFSAQISASRAGL